MMYFFHDVLVPLALLILLLAGGVLVCAATVAVAAGIVWALAGIIYGIGACFSLLWRWARPAIIHTERNR